MGVKACRFLSDVSLRCGESGHTMHMPLSQLQCILLAQGSHKVTFPQAFPKPGPEVEEGALLFPTPPLSTLTCGWELNQGCPLPEWVGYWKVVKNWPSLAQLQISHQSSAPVLWLAGSHYRQVQHLKSAVSLPYRDQSWLSLMAQNKSLLKKSCLVEESLFTGFLNEIMHKTYKNICYWWNFDEHWNHTRINLIVFSLKFNIHFLDPVIDNDSYSAV